MTTVATTNRACVVSYSLVKSTQLQIGVIASRDGSLAAFTTVELSGQARALKALVEATRRKVGARSRSAPTTRSHLSVAAEDSSVRRAGERSLQEGNEAAVINRNDGDGKGDGALT